MPAYDGESELRIFYTTIPNGFAGIQHRHTVDLDIQALPLPGESFTNIFALRRSGIGDPLSVIVDEYVALMLPLLSVNSSIDRAELWYIPEGTTNGQFISTYSIGELGTAGTSSTPAHQSTLTFRSIGGSTMRLQWMELSLTGQNRDAYPTTNSIINNVFDYVISDQCAFLARDNTVPFAPMNFTGGQNEALFRKRYRQ